MQYRSLGNSNISASVVGLGTWAIGGWMWGGTSEADSIRAIHAAIDAGINLIDTAPCYGFGLSEEIVGKAIADRRDKVVLATKCGLVWHVSKGDFFFASDEGSPNPEGDRQVWKYLGPESIRYEVEHSLRRLRTDVIDLYQTHWQESTTPIEETMAELLKLKEEGKIRAIGVSNVTPAQLAEYRRCGVVDSDQESYSMLNRKHDADLLPVCLEEHIAFLAYSPIAQGLLTGKVGPDRAFDEGDQRRNNPRFSRENRRKIAAMLAEFQPIADKHGVSMTQLVIAWTVHQPGCTHALVGARTPDQAHENARAGDIDLSHHDLEHLNRVLSRHTPGLA